jgi:hypothetical protein
MFETKGLSNLKVDCFEHANKIWFVSSFEDVNFTINGKYSKKIYDNLNYYASLVIFQTYQNAIVRSVQSLGWLLWWCFYPKMKLNIVWLIKLAITTLMWLLLYENY